MLFQDEEFNYKILNKYLINTLASFLIAISLVSCLDPGLFAASSVQIRQSMGNLNRNQFGILQMLIFIGVFFGKNSDLT